MERITFSSLDQERLAFFALFLDFISRGPRGNQWCRREIPCGDEVGNLPTPTNFGSPRASSPIMEERASLPLISYRARLWRVTARDSLNLLLYTDSDPVILC